LKEISEKQNKIGNKLRKRELNKKKEKPSKPKDLKKKEKREKVKKYDSQGP
jgi:hypothetical protein